MSLQEVVDETLDGLGMGPLDQTHGASSESTASHARPVNAAWAGTTEKDHFF